MCDFGPFNIYGMGPTLWSSEQPPAYSEKNRGHQAHNYRTLFQGGGGAHSFNAS